MGIYATENLDEGIKSFKSLAVANYFKYSRLDNFLRGEKVLATLEALLGPLESTWQTEKVAFLRQVDETGSIEDLGPERCEEEGEYMQFPCNVKLLTELPNDSESFNGHRL